MATMHFDSTGKQLGKDLHPVWSRAFSELQRRKLTDDDLEAGYQISGILIGVVLFGLLSMVLSVVLAI